MIKTYFNGAVTQEQILALVTAVAVVAVILNLMKGVIKFLITGGVLIGASVFLGIASPSELEDISKLVGGNDFKVVSQIAKASKNIKYNKKNNTLKVKVDGKWIDVSDITSYASILDKCSVHIDGKDYKITDDSIKEILDILSEKK